MKVVCAASWASSRLRSRLLQKVKTRCPYASYSSRVRSAGASERTAAALPMPSSALSAPLLSARVAGERRPSRSRAGSPACPSTPPLVGSPCQLRGSGRAKLAHASRQPRNGCGWDRQRRRRDRNRRNVRRGNCRNLGRGQRRQLRRRSRRQLRQAHGRERARRRRRGERQGRRLCLGATARVRAGGARAWLGRLRPQARRAAPGRVRALLRHRPGARAGSPTRPGVGGCRLSLSDLLRLCACSRRTGERACRDRARPASSVAEHEPRAGKPYPVQGGDETSRYGERRNQRPQAGARAGVGVQRLPPVLTHVPLEKSGWFVRASPTRGSPVSEINSRFKSFYVGEGCQTVRTRSSESRKRPGPPSP
jgi:hypothetical protein